MCPTRSCNFTEHSKDDSSPVFLSTRSWMLRFLFETSGISYKKKSEILLRQIDREFINWKNVLHFLNPWYQPRKFLSADEKAEFVNPSALISSPLCSTRAPDASLRLCQTHGCFTLSFAAFTWNLCLRSRRLCFSLPPTEGWRNPSDGQSQRSAVSCRWAQRPEGLLSHFSLQGGFHVGSEAF